MTWNYQTEVLADSPYLWWRLHEPSGVTAADASGNGRDGTIFGTDLTYDQFGIENDFTARAIRFNQSGSTYDAGVILNPVDGSFPTTDITLEWVWRNYTSGVNRTLVSYASASNADQLRFAISSTSESSTFWINGTSISTSLTGGSIYLNPTDLSTHIVLTWRNSDGRVQLFVNGLRYINAFTAVGVGHSLEGGGSLVLCQDQDSVGGGLDTAEALRVTLSEFAIYNTVLSNSRIVAHASACQTAYYATNELPGVVIAYDDPGADIGEFAVSKKVFYFQRVYDTVASQWCYYTQSTINPSPTATQTTPNHSGSITSHNVVAVLPNNAE